MPAEMHRRQLAEFLRRCRARLEPADVGLPDSKRRRTPGLRREDVAALAGVSVTWYTWLEQGRDIRASADVLEKISTTLRMTLDEREYLFALVQHRPAPLAEDDGEAVLPELARMIDALHVPALVITWRWDIVAWNQHATHVFRDYGALDDRDRNLLRLLLLNPQFRENAEEYETVVSRVLGRYRVDYGQTPDDERMNELIAELSESCPLFDKLWLQANEVSSRTLGVNTTVHPQLGRLTFEHSSYVPEGSPKLRLMIFVPHDDITRQRLAELGREICSGRSHDALN